MIEIELNANSDIGLITQMKEAIGGTIEDKWSECILTVNNENAIGNIRFIPFDWGVNLLDFNIKFHKDFVFSIKAVDKYNPIRFIYPYVGYLKHRFGIHNEESKIDQYQSLIFTNKSGGYNYLHFPKNEQLEINFIEIVRRKFLKKRTTNVTTLNDKLHEMFVDTNHEYRFANYGTFSLKMADLVKKLKNVKGKGMLRILKIEAKVYEILSFHIQQHNRLLEGVSLPTSLTKSELKIVRKLGNAILKKPAESYSLDELSIKSGLTQAKLQDGFKFLFNRTVTEYIRHVRLESARDMLKNTDLNISQIVYSIGFSSRSYFSKIFREKYDITPNEFKKKLLIVVQEK
ncbi:helix-turn-helix transcriptional regulator [Polaribacter aestuariivivens]|uniref:Helix-turn-helix transcriptional regulator n=1 Tax=Polaribacter aestuariivivens TaxID=2304626 RepID=A0A5S3NAT1_9FLAO|nr:AraC family transcriptional regulator [Polaribacter aestuariivivens]TMM32325.1 helix-turn-helix transcriptional regulator [Polaribacter aestuariivivens]